MTEEDDDLGDTVPAAFAVTVARPEARELGAYTFEGLKGEQVVVRANGFLYRGVLVGADEGELYLRGEMRWFVLPLADVTSVAREEPRRGRLGGPERWEPREGASPEDEEA